MSRSNTRSCPWPTILIRILTVKIASKRWRTLLRRTTSSRMLSRKRLMTKAHKYCRVSELKLSIWTEKTSTIWLLRNNNLGWFLYIVSRTTSSLMSCKASGTTSLNWTASSTLGPWKSSNTTRQYIHMSEIPLESLSWFSIFQMESSLLKHWSKMSPRVSD